MGALDSLQDGITAGIGAITDFIGEHPVGVAVGAVGTAAAVGGVVALANSGTKKKAKRKAHKNTHTKRGWKQDRKRRSKQKWEVAYQKRKRKKHRGSKKSRSRKGKHYTKNGQPYILLRSGKARFIKKTKRRS